MNAKLLKASQGEAALKDKERLMEAVQKLRGISATSHIAQTIGEMQEHQNRLWGNNFDALNQANTTMWAKIVQDMTAPFEGVNESIIDKMVSCIRTSSALNESTYHKSIGEWFAKQNYFAEQFAHNSLVEAANNAQIQSRKSFSQMVGERVLECETVRPDFSHLTELRIRSESETERDNARKSVEYQIEKFENRKAALEHEKLVQLVIHVQDKALLLKSVEFEDDGFIKVVGFDGDEDRGFSCHYKEVIYEIREIEFPANQNETIH